MKFSIVTPAYNSEQTIRETIESVISQKGDFEIEYIVMDGDSQDATVEIVKEYTAKIEARRFPTNCKGVSLAYASQKDNGMYDAITRGFAQATGDVFAWINADDRYLPGAFETVSKAFATFPEIDWLKGKTRFITEDGKTESVSPCYIFRQDWIKRGIYGRNAQFIHQDSVFWRKKLWNEAGSIPSQYRLAGDYYLWTRFAYKVKLWSLDREVSCFRRRKGQLSESQDTGYRAEQKEISPEDMRSFLPKLFFWLKNRTKAESFFKALYPIVFPHRKEKYIVLAGNDLVIKETRSYIA